MKLAALALLAPLLVACDKMAFSYDEMTPDDAKRIEQMCSNQGGVRAMRGVHWYTDNGQLPTSTFLSATCNSGVSVHQNLKEPR